MAYQVLARKWRPRTFKQMVGQTHVQRVLINALEQDRLHHAYLFTGTRGVGKTTIARIFAKSVNCEQGIGAEPCGVCATCREVDSGRFVDLIEVDAASRTKVEDTRELLENVQYAPTRGRYKVYLIDEVHMLSVSSFNALLKTLEEPPPHVKFLFATTDPQKLPATILSRCLQFNLKRLTPQQIDEHLAYILGEEQIPFEPTALRLLAKAADGSMRDALSLLDQAIAYGGGQLSHDEVAHMLGAFEQGAVRELLQALAAQDGAALLARVAQMAEHNPDYPAVLGDLLSLLQRIAVAQIVPDAVEENQEEAAALRDLAKQLSSEDVQLYYQIGLLGRRDLPFAPDARGGFEMILLRMLHFRPATALATQPPSEAPAAPRPAPKPTAAPQPARQPAPTPESAAPAAKDRMAAARAALSGLSKPSAAEKKSPAPKPVAKPAPAAPPPASAQTAAPVAPPTPSEPLTSAPPAPAPETPAAPTVAASAEAWAELSAALKLGGMVKVLAENCVLQERQGNHFKLCLPSVTFHTLYNPERAKELEKALSRHLDSAVSLSIELGQGEGASPASLQKEKNKETRRQALQTLQADPNILSLQAAFGAQLEKQSLQLLK